MIFYFLPIIVCQTFNYRNHFVYNPGHMGIVQSKSLIANLVIIIIIGKVKAAIGLRGYIKHLVKWKVVRPLEELVCLSLLQKSYEILTGILVAKFSQVRNFKACEI